MSRRSALARSVVSAVLIAAALSSRVFTQENPLVRDHAGAWAAYPPPPTEFPQGVTESERTTAGAWVRQLFEILHRAPALAPPAGFQVVPYTFGGLRNLDHSDTKRPAYVTVKLQVNLAPFERTSRGVAANERDSAASVTLLVNDLQALMGSETGLGDEEGAFIENPPEPVDTLHGFPVFEEGNSDRWVMIRRKDAPFFAPVTRERYILAKLKEADEQAATIERRRKEIPAGVPASIIATVDEGLAAARRLAANIRAAHTSMSAADRSKPAIVGDSGPEDAPKFEDGGTAVLYFNPALFESAAPRSAPQILAVCISARGELSADVGEKLDREIDWAALQKLVRP